MTGTKSVEAGPSARTGAVRGQAHDRRPGRPAGADGDRAARRRPPARRGRARAGQDARGEVAGGRDRRAVPADPVHPRPGARRPRRHPGLPPALRRVRDLARPGLHQPAAGGRDQPGPGQGAERAAGGDAGAPGHHRPGDVPGAGAVPGHGDPEPDRVGGHLPAAGGAGRPVHDEGGRRLSELARGARDRRPGARPARGAAGDADRRGPHPRCRRRLEQVYVDPAVVDYAVRLVAATRAPGDGRARRAGPVRHLRREPAGVHRARAGRAGRWRSCAAATTSLPHDCTELALDVLRHRIVLSYEALADESTPTPSSPACCGAVPAPDVVLQNR